MAKGRASVRHLLDVSHQPGSYPSEQIIPLVPVQAGEENTVSILIIKPFFGSRVTLTMTFSRQFVGVLPMIHQGRYYASHQKSRLQSHNVSQKPATPK